MRLIRIPACFNLIVVSILCQSILLTPRLSSAQQDKTKTKEVKSGFGTLKAKFLNIRPEGNRIFYSKASLVPKDGERIRQEARMASKEITRMVTVQEEVDGKIVMRTEPRKQTMTYSYTITLGGKTKWEETAVEGGVKFLTLNGKSIDLKKALDKVAMQNPLVIVLPTGTPIPKNWKTEFRPGTLVMQTSDSTLTSLQDGQMFSPPITPVQQKHAFRGSFEKVHTAYVNVRFDGKGFVYPVQRVVSNKGETAKYVAKPVEQTYVVMVPETKIVDGKQVTTMRREERKRTVMIQELVGGRLDYKDQRLPASAKFFSLTDKELDTNAVVSRLGMTSKSVMLLPKGINVPKSWKKLFSKNTVVLKCEGRLMGQNATTLLQAEPEMLTIKK